MFVSKSLNQENTTTKMGWAAIGEQRNDEESVKLFRSGLDKGQNNSGSARGIGHVAAVFRRSCTRVNYQRTLFHHSARGGSERRCCGWPLRMTYHLFLWLFGSAAVVGMR